MRMIYNLKWNNLSILLLLFLFSSINVIFAQVSDLTTALNELKAKLTTVETKKSTYKTTLVFKEEQPYKVTFAIDELGKKGTSTTEFQLNLAYVNEREVKRQSSRNMMEVAIASSDKIIQVFKDGTLANYQNELAIPCSDVDNAREIEEILKKAIGLSNTSWENDIQLPEVYNGLEEFITTRIRDVTIGDELHVQKLEAIDEQVPRFQFTQIKGDKPESKFRFNFADIHPPSVRTIVKGKVVFVEMKIDNRNKFIEEDAEGVISYENELQIDMASFEDAQLLVTGLRKFLKLADEKDKAALPKFTSNKEALDYLASVIPKAYKIDEDEVTQKVKSDCLFELERETTTSKGIKTEKYIVDLFDLSTNEVEIKVGLKGVNVAAKDKDQAKFIGVFEDGERKSYTNSFEIGAASIPAAKKIRFSLSESIKTCKGGIEAKDFKWMTNLLEQQTDSLVAAKGQTLTLIEDDPCKLSLKIIEEGNKGIKESRYEVNLFDLEEKATVLATKGTRAYVQAFSKFKERIISLYDNDGKLKYENNIEIDMPDISSGKVFLVTLKSLIKQCGK